MLPVRSILSDLDSYNIEDLQNNDEYLTIYLSPKGRKARCPRCGKTSQSVHSRYFRTLAHVPITITCVKICLLTRRFRCRNPTCAQRIFAERADGLCRSYARTTEVNRKSLQRIGIIAGANPGQRLAQAVGIPTSATTLRRRILETPVPDQKPVRVLGVDDWAWRKGQRYGTLLCDLESGRIVDLLPDRSAVSLERWIRDHSGIEIISRDRASCYSEGARQGAPDAIQVADRWHLLKNMGEALERLLYRYHQELKDACVSLQTGPEMNASTSQDQEISRKTRSLAVPDVPTREPSQAHQNSMRRREARKERYDQVLELRQQGRTLRAIARETGLSRATVRRYIVSEEFPEIGSRAPQGVQLDLYEPFIKEQLTLGNKTREQLLQDLRHFGYTGSISALSRYITNRLKMRKNFGTIKAQAAKLRCPAPRAVVMTMIRPEEKRTQEEKAFLIRLADNCPQIATACGLAKDFSDMVRQRQGIRFDDWRHSVGVAEIPEIQSFVNSMQQDRDAVIAGLTLEWSNGPTEGHVNRLKTIKRQMYGRAGFKMLRARVLAPP